MTSISSDQQTSVSVDVEDIKELNKDLRAILSSIYDEIIVVDSEGNVIRVSDHLLHYVWDLQAYQLVGKNILEMEREGIIRPSVARLVLENQEKVSIIQEAWNGRRILATGTPVFNQEGCIERIIIASRDITETVNLKSELGSVKRDSERLQKELNRLKDKLSHSFVVYSDKMKEVLKQADKVSRVSATVLLIGESGVGKEMVATAIHQLGERADQPFVKVNCGAIPEKLLESELFGYKRGAFTGADPKGKVGYFTQANKGILFLDEISEMPLNLQVKLLRVLQEREVIPVGDLEPVKIDVQIIAATNKNLEQLVDSGAFREDLYYRLNVVPIHIPPLRERSEDIAFLAYHFINKYNRRYHSEIELSPDAIDLLKVYPWYGNVRELENVIERIIVTSEHKKVDAQLINKMIPWKKSNTKSHPIVTNIMPLQDALDYVEEKLILMAMEQYKSIKLASQVLEVSQPTMSRKYQKIKEKMENRNAAAESNEKHIFEEELNNQLRSIATVTATSLNAEEIKELIADLNSNNPAYVKLQKRLTMIRELEGKIEWNYIWIVTPNRRVINLVTDKKLKIDPGEEYFGPPEMMEVVFQAMKGKVGVTPKYTDGFGEWKSSIAPIKDDSGKVIAVLGSDFSVDYINEQNKKLRKLLKQ